MRRHTLRSGRLGTALCALALVAQATLLPVLHAEHGAVAGLERIMALSAVTAPSAATALAARDRVPVPAHDLASCPVCATLGRAGAAITPAAVAMGTLPLFAGVLRVASSAATAAPDLTRGAPRGPPALVS